MVICGTILLCMPIKGSIDDVCRKRRQGRGSPCSADGHDMSSRPERPLRCPHSLRRSSPLIKEPAYALAGFFVCLYLLVVRRQCLLVHTDDVKHDPEPWSLPFQSFVALRNIHHLRELIIDLPEQEARQIAVALGRKEDQQPSASFSSK